VRTAIGRLTLHDMGYHEPASPSRPCALNEAQMEALDGPDPEHLATRWSIDLRERSVVRLLHRLAAAQGQLLAACASLSAFCSRYDSSAIRSSGCP